MKIYINSSFGVEDSDWIDPVDSDSDYRDIAITFDRNKVLLEDEIQIEDESNIDSEFYEGHEIASSNELINFIYDEIDERIDDQMWGVFELSGTLTIPYTVNEYDKYGEDVDITVLWDDSSWDGFELNKVA